MNLPEIAPEGCAWVLKLWTNPHNARSITFGTRQEAESYPTPPGRYSELYLHMGDHVLYP